MKEGACNPLGKAAMRGNGLGVGIPHFAMVLGLLPLLAGCGGEAKKPAQKELRIAAASDLKFCLDEIAQGFEEDHPGTEVSLQFGASGTLFAQIVAGAPYDLYLSADSFYPEQLKAKGEAAAEGPFPYAVGHLVLWVAQPKPEWEPLGIQKLLESNPFQTIAIANPRHAPYGRAAEAALKSMGLNDKIQSKLVIAENVAMAAQHVSTGLTDAGFLSLATTHSPAFRGKGKAWPMPEKSYPAILQSGVILKSARDPETAEHFKKHLLGTRGQEVLTRYGFTLPGK